MPFIVNLNNGEAWKASNSAIGLTDDQKDFIKDLNSGSTPNSGNKNQSFWKKCTDFKYNTDIPYTNIIPCNGNSPFLTNFNNAKEQQDYSQYSKLLSSGDTLTSIFKNKNNQLLGYVGGLVGSATGVPQISQLASSQTTSTMWNVANPKLVQEVSKFIKYNDFRSEKEVLFRRIDGTSALTRKSIIGGIYAAASVTPGGVYTIFNLDGAGKTGRGWGDHDNPNILRNDFTAMAGVVRTRWKFFDAEWGRSINPLDYATPFVGDKVQVIDFGKRTLKQAYSWKPTFNKGGILGTIINGADTTQDFIKFMLTGPKLQNGSTGDDDIIIFRAAIDSLEDSYSPNWTDQKIIGRADPNYIYQGVSRGLNVQFKVFATTRDEMKPIWRKLNALAGYTAPTYNPDSIAPEAPWMRITIGDLFHQQAVVINSLSYTLHSQETSWEINVEKDPEMFELPHYVSVNLDLKLVTDVLPQKGGKFYALNKWGNYKRSGDARRGNKNWLSDNDTELIKKQDELLVKRWNSQIR
jgi:hypothetical protein